MISIEDLWEAYKECRKKKESAIIKEFPIKQITEEDISNLNYIFKFRI